MKRLAFAACLLLAAIPAFAAPPSAASIERLLVVTDVEKQLATSQRMSEAMMRSMAQKQAAGRTLAPEQQRRMDASLEKVQALVREETSYAKTKPMLVRIYSETFTQEEIDGLIAFYESPAGRAFVAKMPLVMQKSMMLMQERLQPLMKRMEAELREAGEPK